MSARASRRGTGRGLVIAITVGLAVLVLAGAGYLAYLMASGYFSDQARSGSVPPQDSAAQLAPGLLRALEAGDRAAVDRMVPGSPAVEVDEVMGLCAGQHDPGIHPNLSESNGPQAVLVVADGQPAYTVPRAGSCSWWMYWDQDHRSWTIGTVVGSPEPEVPTGG
ncbi:hypothetical protein [Leifsonia sp. 71-9]|uniref:hypothetical protein n=1 Tax=Leifsonia sp. 71-9 TaxID=1895934 RepID=UPI0009270C2F|nr:hypothetical protein [Leifsonia sp. 71-9]OJX72769.1 MAG: hypothetical protein BGO91_13430 [Leifsonia sp. 71-9]